MGPDENKNNLNGFDNQVQGNFSEAQNNLSTTQNNFSAGASLNSEPVAQSAPTSIPISTPEPVSMNIPEREFSSAELDQSRVKSFFGSYNGNRGGRSNSSVRSELDRIAIPMPEAKPKKKLNLRVLIVAVVAVVILIAGGLGSSLFLGNMGGKTLSMKEALPILEKFQDSYWQYTIDYDYTIGSKSSYYYEMFFIFPEIDTDRIREATIEGYDEFKGIKAIKDLDSDMAELFKKAKSNVNTYISNSQKNIKSTLEIYDAFIDPLYKHYNDGNKATCEKTDAMNNLLNSSEESTRENAEAYYKMYCELLEKHPTVSDRSSFNVETFGSVRTALFTLRGNFLPADENSNEDLEKIVKYIEEKTYEMEHK